MIWVNLFIFLLSIFTFIFNIILLIAIGVSPKLHSISNLLSCNLWIANAIISIVAIFQSLVNPFDDIAFLHLNNMNNSVNKNLSSISLRENEAINGTKEIFNSKEKLVSNFDNTYSFGSTESLFFTIAGPQILASLFNSTISMLSLLGMAIVQIFGNRQNYLSRSSSLRITISLWSVIVLMLISNFTLIQTTRSLTLLFAFHIALLTIFLLINLLLHPINLLFSLKENSNTPTSRAITEALWLLFHSLSFIILVIMLIWESSQNFNDINNIQLVYLQQATYNIHCIVNPLIALIRDTALAQGVQKVFYTKHQLSYREYPSILTTIENNNSNNPHFSQWVFSEQLVIRFDRPPPPYITPTNSIEILYDDLDESNRQLV
uniref:G-protein coupled receptors family 1 profile domain-containing protein n=1 Tax=Strongyloides venezuelensis TaxID=75913 RepID=A0A0K0FLI1_STRVS